MNLADLTLLHIHPHNLHWLGFALVDWNLETCPVAANDDNWGL